MVILVWLAFALRALSLSSQSVWWDEAFTWQTTSHGWDNLWRLLQTGDRNPPLYFVLTTVWGGIAGWSEFSLRFVSLACGLIGVAFLFALARRLFGRPAGRWTLGLAAIAPALVAYSQEARMYALFFALTAALLYFAARRAPTALLLAEAGLLLTHYFAVPLVAALNLLALADFFQKRASIPDYARWLIGQLAAALPLIVWTLWVFTAPDSLIQAAERPPSVIEFARQALVLWLTGGRDLNGAWGPLAVIGLIAIGAATLGAWRIDRARAGGLIAFGSIALLLGFALTQALTAFHPRYLLAFSVPGWVLAGAALSRVKVKWLALIVVIGFMAAGWSAALDPAYAQDDARGVAAYLKANASANEVILIEANDYTLAYYDHGPATRRMITATTAAEALTQLRSAVGEAKRVWLAHWTISTQDTVGYWRFLLEQAGRLTAWQSFRGYEVYEYELENALVDPALERGAVSITSVDAGALTLALDWPLASVPAASDWQRSSIALIDSAGQRVSGVDADLRAGRNYAVLPIPPGTPPLAQTVSIKFYTAQRSSAAQIVGKITAPRSASEADPYRVLSGYRWQPPATPIDNLEAYSLAPPSPAPLGPVEIMLRWRKTGARLDGRARLAQADRVWAELPADLIARDYPFAAWAPGETVLDRRTLIYPPVRGTLQLQIAQGDQWLDVATLTLDESQLTFDAPAMAPSSSARFGEVAELLGYTLNTSTLAPDRPLTMTVYWRAINAAPLTTAYTAFTQLLAPDGHLVAQHDAPPNPPTIAWVPGQIVADAHALQIVDAVYRGPATLIVGWYNSASIARVAVVSGGDFVKLEAPVTVEDR